MNRDCAWAEERHIAGGQGELPEEEQGEWEAHLAGCRECREESASLGEVLRALQTDAGRGEEDPGALYWQGFSDRVRAGLKGRETESSAAGLPLRWRWALPWAGALAALAVATVWLADKGEEREEPMAAGPQEWTPPSVPPQAIVVQPPPQVGTPPMAPSAALEALDGLTEEELDHLDARLERGETGGNPITPRNKDEDGEVPPSPPPAPSPDPPAPPPSDVAAEDDVDGTAVYDALDELSDVEMQHLLDQLDAAGKKENP